MKILVFKQKDGSYIINESDLSAGKHLINDIKYTIRGCGYESKVITTDKIPVIKRCIEKKYIKYYFNKENSSKTMSVNDYENKSTELRKDKVDEDGYWNSLESEFEYKKFVRDWGPFFDTKVELTDVEVEIQDKIYSNNFYITPCQHYGNKIVSNMFYYDRYKSVMAEIHNVAKKHGYKFTGENSTNKQGTYSIPKHSGLRFCQISGNYFFNAKWDIKRGITDTYDKCIEWYNDDVAGIEHIFLLDKNKNKKMTKKIASEILSKCKTIKSCFSKIDYKQKSYRDYHNVGDKIRDLIKTLEFFISKEE